MRVMTKDKSDTLKKEMLKALESTLGIVTGACKRVGIARNTHYRWLQEDEEYRKECEDIEEMCIDFAESQLHLQIKEGNTSATIFFLKTKGKKRGYVERQELDVKTDRPDFSSVSTEDLMTFFSNAKDEE